VVMRAEAGSHLGKIGAWSNCACGTSAAAFAAREWRQVGRNGNQVATVEPHTDTEPNSFAFGRLALPRSCGYAERSCCWPQWRSCSRSLGEGSRRIWVGGHLWSSVVARLRRRVSC